MELDEVKKQKALQAAKNLADDFDEDEAKEFINRHKNAKWYDNFILLYQMITDKDFKVSKKTYLTIAGALAYAVLPLDVIPDFIPGVGFIDDAFVLSMAIKSVSDEIERFKKYNGMKE